MVLKKKPSKFGKGYLGNANLKRVGEVIEFNPDHMLEIQKCQDDFLYFIKTYVSIVTIDHGKMKFALRNYQERFLQSIHDNRFNIIKIPRQYGKTEAVAAYMLWLVLFHPDYRIAVLAHKKGQAIEILDRIKMAYELIPKWLQQGVKEWNKGNIWLENDSKIFAEATSAGSVRGRTYNFVYLDEFAHVEVNEQESFFTGTYPVITAGMSSKMVITSTPKGLEKFYEIWRKSELGKNSYKRTEVHWSEMPGREVPGPGEAWKQETIENTSERQFEQEFGCSFLGSMNTLIDGNVLGRIITEDPIRNEEDSKTMNIYADPIAGHSYVINVDVAKGIGGDFSAFTVIDITSIPYKIVATYYDNEVSYLVFPNRIYHWANHYNKAFVLVELNELGQSVADELHYEYEYENIFQAQTKPKVGQVINAGFGGNRIELGVRMNKQVKRVGCSTLKDIVEKNLIQIPDVRIVSELSHFVEKKQSHQAEPGHHDDLTMCLVSFSWLTKQDYFKEITGTNVGRTVLKDAITMIEDNVVPGGWINNGADNYPEDDFNSQTLARETVKRQIEEAKIDPTVTKEQVMAAEALFKLYGV